MGFMIKPCPYVDPSSLNRPLCPPELPGTLAVGMLPVTERLLAALPEGGVLLLDGHVGARFSTLLERLHERAPAAGLGVFRGADDDPEPALPRGRKDDPCK